MRQLVLLLSAIALIGNILLPYSYAQTVAGGVGSYNGAVRTASANTVIFVYPATGGTKPSGVGPALFTDWTAIGILIGVTQNAQYETLDTNTGTPLFVSTSTGQPCTSACPASVLVTIGGPLVHAVVHYLEVVLATSPVYYAQSGVNQQFIKRSDSSVLASQAYTVPVTSQDYFVIYTMLVGGLTLYVFYGLRWTGSLASSHRLLEWVQSGTLGSHTSSFEVWRWSDDGDGLVEGPSFDTYTLIASG